MRVKGGLTGDSVLVGGEVIVAVAAVRFDLAVRRAR